MSLKENIQFYMQNDPAAKSELEVFLCYPGLHAFYLHKIAHRFYINKFYLIARMISQLIRFFTGIEIHPGASLSEKVFIDHGMGVVIGETAEVEEEVVIYQGVTLGGILGDHPEKRHPTIKRGTLIGANAQILGGITIGENCQIGAGSVVVKNIPDNSTVVGVPGKIL